MDIIVSIDDIGDFINGMCFDEFKREKSWHTNQRWSLKKFKACSPMVY